MRIVVPTQSDQNRGAGKILWLVWSIGAILFMAGVGIAIRQGSHIWLLLVLGGFLGLVLRLFPARNYLVLTCAGLGFYLPLVGLFFLRSHASSSDSLVWPYALSGGLVLSVSSLIALLHIDTARRALGWLLGAILCGFLIGYFSGGRGAADPWIDFFVIHFRLTAVDAQQLVHLSRKTIHFSFYGTLAWFAARGALAGGANKRSAFMFAILWGVAHAVFDETRQIYSPLRGPSMFDVGIDALGMLVFTSQIFFGKYPYSSIRES